MWELIITGVLIIYFAFQYFKLDELKHKFDRLQWQYDNLRGAMQNLCDEINKIKVKKQTIIIDGKTYSASSYDKQLNIHVVKGADNEQNSGD